jgi:glycosyltransferase involved in cell wall biosynthesis
MPKLSVICTAFNAGPRMKDTLEGIIAQTYKDWELLVMDGASKDGTVELIKSYCARDPRIKIFSEPDEGPLHAYEKGLARAAGDYLIFTCGQDYFSDSDWFSTALEILEKDKQIALVWALGRGITEDGREIGTNAAYKHFVEGRGRTKSFGVFISKCIEVAGVLLFGSWEKKKFLLQKIFSKSAGLRIRSITAPGFAEGKFPQKEDWFFYWLKTGLTFPDQCLVVSKKVYLECAPRYEMGSKRVNSFGDFIFNFQTKGYLPYFVPRYVGYGLLHAGSSGNRAAGELQHEDERYLEMIRVFREKSAGKTITFRDRDSKPVSERKII